ncbi:MAG: maleylpyruvate isomerase family mycothiol-dependent enzyme, partial [Nocardioidaceae bacterium]
VGKRVGPPAGTTVVLDVTGVHPVHLVAAVGDDGRGHLVTDEPAAPTVTLRMDLETFVILSGGRRTPDNVTVEVTGDQELGGRVLAAMSVTP